ncbi:hypothetical protein JCM8208_004231 [Rhodotorula glutinis]
MSARTRSARKSTASTFSYAEPPSSSNEDEGSELDDDGRGEGGRKSRSKGPTKRPKGKAKAAEVDSSNEGDEDDQPRKKARKPAKAKQSKQKKGTGKFEILKTLPVEKITEIFSHLYPNDLLALSKVNKQYRALLTAKSSSRLWKAARDKLELPDLVTDNFGEIQYASLIFERECQLCGVNNNASVEPRLRIRYCKSCRTKEIVELSSLKRLHPDVLIKLHPRAQNVVLKSNGKVLLSDLYRADVILRDLEDQDEDSDIAEGGLKPVPESSAASSSSRRRSTRTSSSKKWTTRQGKDSDDEDDSTSRFTRRVDEYVVERSALFDEVEKHTVDIMTACSVAKQHLHEVKWHGHGQPAVERDPNREPTLRQKILDLDLGYVDTDFWGPWWTSKLVRSPDPLTDEEWVRVKPKLLKLLDRHKKAEAKRALALQQAICQSQRQSGLRPFYDKLYKSLDKSARPFVPLFGDFLLLPSVKPLWAGDDDVSEQAWTDALDDIKEDLEQFRLDLVVHVRELIFEATTDPDERSTAQDYLGLGDDDLDLDAFFSLATSFVCCDVRGCRRPRKYSGHWWFGSGGPVRDEYRQFGSIGTLITVLEHLHKYHNADSVISSQRGVKAQPQFHVSLPLEVACAVSALLEVNQLDPATAGLKNLERAGKGVRKYVWENYSSSWRNYAGERAWFALLHAVKKTGEKLARLKPPVYLDPPVVVMHPLRSYRAPAADLDDQQKQTGDALDSEEEIDRDSAAGEEDLMSEDEDSW